MTQVYLVPGFFGFTELGSFNYFNRVSEVFGQALVERSIDAEIIETDTLPTGSIRRRATRLLETVRKHGGLEHEDLHFVGHSAGGLDIRMLLTPGVKLLPTGEEQEIGARTRTAITVSTPHYGTPLASVFTSLNGRYLLYVLTVLATSGPGRYGLYIASRFLSTFAGLDHLIGQEENILDSFAENVLRKLRPQRGDELWKFIEQISQDQGAIVQLTPESMDLFNGTVPDRKSVEYVSFLSASPAPRLRQFMLQPRNLYKPITHTIYALSHTMAGRVHRQYPYPIPEDAAGKRISEQLPFPVDVRTNDGIVPTLSQIWGRLGGVVLGDHLDLVGQFQHVRKGTAYTTWLHSGSGFDEHRFQRLWQDVAAVIEGSQS
jgi:triacylglycerol lipase